MRKISLFLVFLLCATLIGCAPSQEEAGLQVLATFYPVYVAALNVTDGVEGVTLSNMASPKTGCLHDYSLTTQDRLAIEKADLILANGLGMESFLDEVLKTKTVAEVSEGYPGVLAEESHETTEEASGHEHGSNAHIWLSIEGAKYQTQQIQEALCDLDPAHAEQYRQNADAYIAKLDRLLSEYTEAALNRNTSFVLYHEGLLYLSQEFGLNAVAVIEREPGEAPSAAELADTAAVVAETGARLIFTEPGFGQTEAETLARETGAEIYNLDPVTSGELNDPDAYLTAMRANLKTLKSVLA